MPNSLQEAARALLDRLDAIHEHPAYKSVWTVNQLHCGPYTGPMYVDELAVLRTALAAEADRVSGWRPISTAPKDGTYLLAYWGQVENAENGPANYGVAFFCGGLWRNVDDDDDWYAEPTHWQPLPARPEVNNG